MAKTRVQDYVEKYSDQPIRFTPYALKKTGLVPSQVFLKIEDYLLICAPFQLSIQRGIFLVVLSAQEITFFQQFQKKLCTINLTFQQTGSKKPLSFLLRGTLERIGPVKGKQNVCMMDASIKACPNDLVEIIGDYLIAFDGLKKLPHMFIVFQMGSFDLGEPGEKMNLGDVRRFDEAQAAASPGAFLRCFGDLNDRFKKVVDAKSRRYTGGSCAFI